MINVLLSLAVGLAVTLAIRVGTELGWIGAILPGFVAAAAAYVVLARRTGKQLEAIFDVVQKEVQAQRFEKAIQTLQGAFVLSRWQFLVATQIHSNIGILHYVRQGFDAALPHLQKSYARNWIARGMLGAALYRRKDVAGALRVLEAAAKANRKEGVVWALYAWVLESEGRHDEAIRVMSRAAEANKSDEKVKACLQALQNDRKLKLGKIYGEQWYQFYLERIPPELMGPAFRGGKRAVYGRR
ncbi:MAG TPA: tetratricopeptide repeat protein [Anaeromyxobacteraceae bacterium]|nr:tetratricopeptide repeat protein [Anaeromyxobacteraceae bacterium]